VVTVPSERFEALVIEALDSLPPELGRQMRNVAVLVEDDPPVSGLLGRYEGIPLTERGDWYSGVLPDRITIYRTPICALSETEDQVVEQVRVTVIHEVAHHFGIDDARLDELGWR
jgi:predicted Zn-dependent protease with MMP-like domain